QCDLTGALGLQGLLRRHPPVIDDLAADDRDLGGLRRPGDEEPGGETARGTEGRRPVGKGLPGYGSNSQAGFFRGLAKGGIAGGQEGTTPARVIIRIHPAAREYPGTAADLKLWISTQEQGFE